tara:strand:+ start:484 stop:1038 length:555 start_codon:yes stop_codon:yes gene_type:complete
MKLSSIYAQWVLESTPAGWDDLKWDVFVDSSWEDDGTDEGVTGVFPELLYLCSGDESQWDGIRKKYTDRKDIHVWRDTLNGNILKDVLRPCDKNDKNVFLFVRSSTQERLLNELSIVKDYPGRVFLLIDDTTSWAVKQDEWKDWTAQKVVDGLDHTRVKGAGFIPTKKSMNDRMFIFYDKKNVD